MGTIHQPNKSLSNCSKPPPTPHDIEVLRHLSRAPRSRHSATSDLVHPRGWGLGSSRPSTCHLATHSSPALKIMQLPENLKLSSWHRSSKPALTDYLNKQKTYTALISWGTVLATAKGTKLGASRPCLAYNAEPEASCGCFEMTNVPTLQLDIANGLSERQNWARLINVWATACHKNWPYFDSKSAPNL